jgi:hypothetical protein
MVIIRNDQGVREAVREAVVDAVAPFLRELKGILPLFEEPEVYVSDGAIVASLHLVSRRADLPGEAVEQVLQAVRKTDLVVRISAAQSRLQIEVYGFPLF